MAGSTASECCLSSWTNCKWILLALLVILPASLESIWSQICGFILTDSSSTWIVRWMKSSCWLPAQLSWLECWRSSRAFQCQWEICHLAIGCTCSLGFGMNVENQSLHSILGRMGFETWTCCWHSCSAIGCCRRILKIEILRRRCLLFSN